MANNTMTPAEVRAMRRRSTLYQTEFWGRIGVSQSAGSRFETNAALPKYAYLLLQMAYGNAPLFILATLRGETVKEFMQKQGYVREQ